MPKGIYNHRPLTKEHRKNISKALKNSPFKIGFKKGCIPWIKGKKGVFKHTEETKKWMSESRKGKKHWAYGKTFSKEHRRKMRLARLGVIPWNKGLKGFQAGEKHPNWRGGVTKYGYSFNFNKELKELIRKRDNYECQMCGCSQEKCQEEHNEKLCVHHINYNKKNNNPDNLISLCKRCHAKTITHPELWVEYFGEVKNGFIKQDSSRN